MGNAHAFQSDKIGFQVTNISPRSPGEKAGLQLTDFILTMNGQDIAFIDPEKIMTTVKVIEELTIFKPNKCINPLHFISLELSQSPNSLDRVQYLLGQNS